MRLLCMVVLAACGGAPRSAPGGAVSGASAQPDERSSDRSGATAHPIGPHASGSPDKAGARDCDKLISHALALGIAERPEDQKLTGDERATLRAQLRTSWTPKCEVMTSRGYDCALAATSLAALEACGS